jgi:hypothetical protein
MGSRGPTMQSLVEADKRLVFSYVDNAVVAGKKYDIFPPLIMIFIFL